MGYEINHPGMDELNADFQRSLDAFVHDVLALSPPVHELPIEDARREIERVAGLHGVEHTDPDDIQWFLDASAGNAEDTVTD